MKIRKALVTGGSGAIGGAICRALADDGLYVVVHANQNREMAQNVVEAIEAKGGSADAVAFDITDEKATSKAIEALITTGPVQVLVNNAGIHDDAPMAGMSRDQWHSVVDVSLNGFFNVTRPLLMPMMRTRWGRIINISSISGIIGNRGQTNYAAAKAGLHGATKSLALECASRGVTVNAVAPGIIETPELADLFPPERIKSLVPMKRAGKPNQVAALVSFLASEDASYITGQIIAISGGLA